MAVRYETRTRSMSFKSDIAHTLKWFKNLKIVIVQAKKFKLNVL